MRTIFAEYNPKRNSIDVYTSVGYMLRIDCWEVEKNLKTTPGSEAFQSVHNVTFILCYTVLYNFLALVFALIRVRKHWWDDITQGKQ